MNVATYQKIMLAGSAMMYRTRLVKLKSKKIFPTNPQTRDATLSQYAHLGSLNGLPSNSPTTPPLPSLISILQYVTRAAIETTLARGAIADARSGIAVEANHQSLSPSSSKPLILNLHHLRMCIEFLLALALWESFDFVRSNFQTMVLSFPGLEWPSESRISPILVYRLRIRHRQPVQSIVSSSRRQQAQTRRYRQEPWW